MRITKALSWRRTRYKSLPATTKICRKENVHSIVDKPTIQFIVEEATGRNYRYSHHHKTVAKDLWRIILMLLRT